MRTIIDASGLEALTGAELEAVSGGSAPPGWWYLVQLALSELGDFIEGLKAGYDAT